MEFDLKLGFVYGSFCLGGGTNGFDFHNLRNDPRGLTGSELSYFRLAEEMAELGHDVNVITFGKGQNVPCRIGKVNFAPLPCSVPLDLDAVYSWNEPDIVKDFPCLKIVNLQINTFTHCRPGFEDFIDLWTSPSEGHRDRIIAEGGHAVCIAPGNPPHAFVPDPNNWVVVPNGCDPSLYDDLVAFGVQKVSGRVIWASSPDRGLHWLLQEWPKIRRAVPHANLRIFYKLDKWLDHMCDHPDVPDPDHMEQKARAVYIREALKRLEGKGIEVIGSVSRSQIDREMAEAEVVAYSCDPITWTEGFSVTLMEACAAGSAPVSTNVDALGSIYGEHIPLIQTPVGNNMKEFSDIVVRLLKDSGYRSDVNRKARALSERFTWRNSAATLDRILREKLPGR